MNSNTNTNPIPSNQPLPDPVHIRQEPASDWASSTLTALSPENATGSNVTTPGYEFPGAYPGAHLKPKETNVLPAAVKELSPAGVLETASQYVPSQDDVRRALESAGEAVGGYLPESVRAYLPGAQTDKSLAPSSHLGGVGDLPGTPNESDVARLPEERRLAQLPSHDAESHTPLGKSGGVGSLPGDSNETGVALLPDEKKAQLPSNDAKSHTPLGKSGGVGPLPGDSDEAGVALLPDEKQGENNGYAPALKNATIFANSGTANPAVDVGSQPSQLAVPVGTTDGASSNASTKTLHGSTQGSTKGEDLSSIGGVASLGGASVRKAEDNPHFTPDAVRQTNDFQGPSSTQGPIKEETRSTQASVNTAARSHPIPGQTSPTLSEKPIVGHFDSDRATVGHGPTETEPTKLREEKSAGTGTASTTSGSSQEHEHTKKAGFMDKIKGEVKVLSGKIGHNEEKIEEGRRLMGKN